MGFSSMESQRMERANQERIRHTRNISQDSTASISSDHFTSEHGTEHYFQQVSSTRYKHQHTAINMQLIEATRIILFALSNIHSGIRQCLSFTANEKLSTTFSRALHEADTATQSLIQALDKMDHATPQRAGTLSSELVTAAGSAVSSIRKIIQSLQSHLKPLMQASDVMFTRNLLLNIHGAASNVRIALETISSLPSYNNASTPKTAFAPSPSRSTHKSPATSYPPVPPPLQSTSSTPTSSHALPQAGGGFSGPLPEKVAIMNRGRSHSEHSTSTMQAFAITPQTSWERDLQLFNHINIATAAVLNVVELLNSCFEHSPLPDDAPAAFEKRFKDLLRQVQHASEMSRRLQSSLQNVIASRSVEANDGPAAPNKELSRKFWEDTNACLLAIVAMMTLVKAVATQEDYSFPKSVKQGLSQVTRVTAEVARLWSNSSFAAEEGYYLG
ncbi:RAM signaling pathway [Umbelopsis sp. PMI_123]|nr:RAM signaling pathway [Umbelopsis sp. PMI_123]